MLGFAELLFLIIGIMLEASNSTSPIRVVGVFVIWGVLGARDWMRNSANPIRVKEYGFLIVSKLLSVVYGTNHDHVTATNIGRKFPERQGA